MARPKSLLKQSKSKNKTKSAKSFPETADEYQAAGVELEEAGEKWRAGDAGKSMRFFNRAIETYERGLQRFPTSQDLAYNKARAELETITHPLLVRQLQTPLVAVLNATLASHRYVLGLAPSSTDTLFNTAQVLNFLAEELTSVDARLAVQYSGEACELLERCLSLQEASYAESQILAAQAPGHPSELGHEQYMSSDAVEQEQWVSILEPVTKDTLVDSAVAQASSLTTLCSILATMAEVPGGPSLGWVEEYSSKLLYVQLPALVEGTDRAEEVSIAKAVFISTTLEAAWRRKRIDVLQYQQERYSAFAGLPLSESYAASMANVTSIFDFNNALSETDDCTTATSDLVSLRWSALAAAISQLAVTAKLPNLAPEELANTHVFRGNASLYQYQLSKPPFSSHLALKSSATLLKNAEVFYRNTSKLTHDDTQRDKSLVQEAVAMALQDSSQAWKQKMDGITAQRGAEWVKSHLDDMLINELVDHGDLLRLGLDV